MYILQVKVTAVSNEPNEVVVVVTVNLADSVGVPFEDRNGGIDSFIIRAPKSSNPPTVDLAYLTTLAAEEIAKKYDQVLVATGEHNSDTLEMSETDIQGVFPELLVSGPGLASATSLLTITSPTSILLASPLVLEFTGNSTAQEFTRTGTTSTGSTAITGISSTTGIEGLQNISGNGILAGSLVTAIVSGSEIRISQEAIASASVTLTFDTDPESEFLDSLSPAIFDDSYVGLNISGPGIPNDTTIDEVISTSRIRLSNFATSTNSAAIYTVSGSPNYTFDTSALTVDYTGLQKVVDIIDFSNL